MTLFLAGLAVGLVLGATLGIVAFGMLIAALRETTAEGSPNRKE